MITVQAAPHQTMGVLHALLEIPLSSGVVIFLGMQGLVRPKAGKPLTIQAAKNLGFSGCLDHHAYSFAPNRSDDRRLKPRWRQTPFAGRKRLFELPVPQLFQHLRQ